MKLSVIIPVFNEVTTVAEIVRRVEDVRLPSELTAKEIIVVNDYSTDGTTDLLGALGLRYRDLHIIHHKKNRGKGAALRTGTAGGRTHRRPSQPVLDCVLLCGVVRVPPADPDPEHDALPPDWIGR